MEIFDYLIRHFIVLFGAYLLFKFFLEDKNCFVYNRFYLLGTMLISLISPIIQFDLASYLNISDPLTILLETVNVGTSYEIEPVADSIKSDFLPVFIKVIQIIYLGVFSFLLLRFVYQLFKLIYLIKLNTKQKRKHLNQDYFVVNLSSESAPFTFLNYIFLDENHDSEKANHRRILHHELAHVTQKHTLDVLITEIICIIFWFNPLVWSYKKAIQNNHEYLADHYSTKGQEIEDYAQLLVKQLFFNIEIPIGSHFNKSLTLKRIKMMKNQKQIKAVRYYWTAPFLVLLLGLVSCNALSSTEVNHQTEELSSENGQSGQNGIYTVVDTQAEFEGGIKAFYSFIGKNLRYPEEAKAAGVQGKVFVEFVIDEQGNLVSPKVLNGIGHGCDAEAIRVISMSPKWKAGQLGNTNVKIKRVIPILYKL